MAGTFKEILSIATDTTQKEVARSFNIINKNMGDRWGASQPTTHVKDFMRRFCNQLGLKHQDVVVAEEFALAACPRDGRQVTLPWWGLLSVPGVSVFLQDDPRSLGQLFDVKSSQERLERLEAVRTLCQKECKSRHHNTSRVSDFPHV